MNEVTNKVPTEVNPLQLMNRMNANFARVDLDQNGAISKEEAKEVLSAKGIDSARIDEMFTRMDANADGEVTQQEQRELIDSVKQRMRNLSAGGMKYGDGFDSLSSLLESLSEESTDEGQKEELDRMIAKIGREERTEKLVMESLVLLDRVIPSIDLKT